MPYTHEYYLRNREAILEKTNAYFREHPELYRSRHQVRKLRDHELTQEEYDTKLAEQQGVCAICGKVDSRSLSIDHAHACCSGEKSCVKCTRGLLCNSCNKRLSVVEDSEFLKKALGYLSKWKSIS